MMGNSARADILKRGLRWPAQAEAEIKAALTALAAREWFAASFWSHQAAEKALKALLISSGSPYRDRGLIELGKAVEEELNMDISGIEEDLKELSIT